MSTDLAAPEQLPQTRKQRRRAYIIVGDLIIHEPSHGHVRIEVATGSNAGERAVFSALQFQQHVEDFYNDNF